MVYRSFKRARFPIVPAVLLACSGPFLVGAKGQAKEPVAKSEIKESTVPLLPYESLARTFFRRHDYQAALATLTGKTLTKDAKWIAGESLFRLGKYKEAKAYFEQIINESADRIEKRKASIRVFDTELYGKDLPAAIDSYVKFEKDYKNPPAIMKYGLGKALYDGGYFDHARKTLSSIKKGNEFFMRARYILAAMGLNKRSPQASVKLFHQIEGLKPVSTEDYTVRDMAILAQGRIYADSGRADLAEKAYSRVPLAGKMGETATIELIRTMLRRADFARLGEGKYQRASAFQKELIEKQAIEASLKAIERYRKTHEIDWRKPELLTLMASLFVEARRYEEGRMAFLEITSHYRPIVEALRVTETENHEVWPYFALDYDRPQGSVKDLPVIGGVPSSLVAGIVEIKEIVLLKDRIEDSGRRLRTLVERAHYAGVSEKLELLSRARLEQQANERAYVATVVKKQKEISRKLADILNQVLAEAEFKRAGLSLREMKDLEKQIGVVHQFQAEKMEMFDKSLKEIDEGGSS